MDLYLVKKIITPFLLLPGLFVLFFIAGGLRSLLRGRPGRALVQLLIAAALWIPATPPVAGKLLRTLESGLTIPTDPKGDVIIMMGGAVYDGSPDLSGIGIPSEGTWDRIVTVARLQRRLGVPVILSGGQVHPERAPMGPIYRRLLTDLGVPQDLILLEDQSRDTLENAQFSKALCQAQGFRRPIVVTSALHIRRTQLRPGSRRCFTRQVSAPGRIKNTAGRLFCPKATTLFPRPCTNISGCWPTVFSTDTGR